MLLKMARVQVIGSRANLNYTVRVLHRLGVLHIEDAAKSGTLGSLVLDDAAVSLKEALAFLSVRLDAVIQLLPDVEDSHRKPEPIVGLALDPASEIVVTVRSVLDEITPVLQNLAQTRDALHAELMALPRYETTLRKLAPLAVELHTLQGFDTVALLIDKPYRDVLDQVRLEIQQTTHGQFEIIAQEVDERTTAAFLVYPNSFAAEVQSILGHENITQVRLPKELAGGTFQESLAALDQRKNTIPKELARIDAELEKIAREKKKTLAFWRKELQNYLQELAIRDRFGGTRYTFVVEGWLPRAEIPRLRETLSHEVGAQVMVHILEDSAVDWEKAPIAFDNPAPFKPFERLVRLVDLPKYGAIDPTPILAVFLPLFFGIMLGDVAYGVCLLALAIYVRRRFAGNPTIADIAQVLQYGAIWAILFGFLYGEFLGTLGTTLGMKPLWMAREGEQIMALFTFCIGLGVVQIVMGLLLGIWQAWQEKLRNEYISKIGMLIALCAMFGIIGIAVDTLPRILFTPAIIGLLLGIVLLIIPAGPIGLFLGPLEVLETVGNILSYLRLAAIGLSSLYLALVANQMAGLVGNLLIGSILALLLHVLNFALGIMSPTIQSLRLHYVEFFRQFYVGGGQEYRPFKMG